MESGWEAAVSGGLRRQAGKLSAEKAKQSRASASPFLVPPSVAAPGSKPCGAVT